MNKWKHNLGTRVVHAESSKTLASEITVLMARQAVLVNTMREVHAMCIAEAPYAEIQAFIEERIQGGLDTTSDTPAQVTPLAETGEA